MEVMQKISDKPLARHAKCGGKLTKEWSRTGFQFKGSGWYVTDYAGRKSEASEGSGESKETKDAPKSDAAAAASADTTPAPKEKKGRASKTTKAAPAPTGGD